jgi:rubrerythrin
MAMKVYRCRICGETYLGEEVPDKCPFCGAERTYLIPAGKWTDENKDLNLTDRSKKNLEESLEIEIANSRFYLCAGSKAKDKDPELEGMFKRLAKVEREHASLFSKMLKVPLPEVINTPLECDDKALINVLTSAERETNAVNHYAKFLTEATEDRVKLVFQAVLAVEKTHLELDALQKSRLSLVE